MGFLKKIGQVLLLLIGMSLIAGGTVLGLHGFTAQAVWLGPILGIADAGIGLTLLAAGVGVIVFSTRSRARPRQRIRIHKRMRTPRVPSHTEKLPDDSASDLEALIRWDENAQEGSDSVSGPLAEAYPGRQRDIRSHRN